MTKRLRSLSILSVIIFLISACGPWAVQTQPKEQIAPKAAFYESILGRSVTDEAVADFVARNECSSANAFLLCQAAGMALWIDSNQVVEIVYLYLNHVDGFTPYNGELPYGLKYYDIMGAVEYKLKKHGLGKNGLPDEGGAPDHLHYWATYHQAGLTIIYNSPSPEDEDATIHAILVGR
jgi:hypothetical protein